MSDLADRIARVLEAELDEHGCEDDDEKRWQVARHWAERVTDLLIDMAGTGQLLSSIDQIGRATPPGRPYSAFNWPDFF